MIEPNPPPIQQPRNTPPRRPQNTVVVLLALIAVLLAAAVGVGSIIAIRLFTAPSAYDEFKSDMRQAADEAYRKNIWNAQVLERVNQMEDENRPEAEVRAYHDANWDKPPPDFKAALK